MGLNITIGLVQNCNYKAPLFKMVGKNMKHHYLKKWMKVRKGGFIGIDIGVWDFNFKEERKKLAKREKRGLCWGGKKALELGPINEGVCVCVYWERLKTKHYPFSLLTASVSSLDHSFGSSLINTLLFSHSSFSPLSFCRLILILCHY